LRRGCISNIYEEHGASIFRVKLTKARMLTGEVEYQAKEHKKTGHSDLWFSFLVISVSTLESFCSVSPQTNMILDEALPSDSGRT
jgi:hypothetical protein